MRTRRKQSRSEETRHRVLEAAIETFANLGFEGTSTRALVERAGLNLTAIHYHFGGKEGLYQAAAAHIAAEIETRLKPVVEEVHSVIRKPNASRAQLIDSICDLFRGLAAHILTDEFPDTWARFIVREQLKPSKAFESFFAAMTPFVEALSVLIGRAMNRSADQPTVRLQLVMMLGQVMIFRTSRSAALRIVGWRIVGKAEQQMLGKMVKEHVYLILEQSQSLPVEHLESGSRESSNSKKPIRAFKRGGN